MDERRNDQQPQPPSEATPEFRGLVENLAQPVVIMDGAGTIRFMNPCAERLLARGLKERVEAHLKSSDHRQPVSQVRFRLEGSGEIILRILRSDLEWKWQGQPATLMSLTDVTPDSATARRLTQEIAKPREREGAPQDRGENLEMQLKSPAASSQPLAQEISPFQKSWEEALAQRDQREVPLKEPVTEKERVEPSHRAELEARAGQSVEEQWASLRQLQAAAAESERRAAAAQMQAKAEAQKARAQRRQAQEEAQQQLHRRIAEAIQQRDNALVELAKVKATLEELAARCDQYKTSAEQRAEELRQQIAQRQQAHEEKQQLRQKLAKSMAAVETFRAGFEALKDQAKASADEMARENEALRRKLAEHEREEESLKTMLKNFSSPGNPFFGVIEKFKADGQPPPSHEIPGTWPEGGGIAES